MSWLGALFGRGRPAAEAPQPAPVDPGNPVHRWLEATGLPWRLARAELAERFGVARDPLYGEPAITFDLDPPPVPGLLRPLSARADDHLAPFAPATEFSGVAWFGEDARDNLRPVAQAIEPALGPARIRDEANTVTCRWEAGPASVALIVWPPDTQGDWAGSNPAHQAEPRLATACHVYIRTGLRLAATAQETAWLESFQPLAELPDAARSLGAVRNTAAGEHEMAFVREPEPGTERIVGRVGLSADRQALIFCVRQLSLVRLEDLARFELYRILPAKGPGGAQLSAVCRRGRSGDETHLSLASADRPNDLDQLADALAKAVGRPLRASEGYDV